MHACTLRLIWNRPSGQTSPLAFNDVWNRKYCRIPGHFFRCSITTGKVLLDPYTPSLFEMDRAMNQVGGSHQICSHEICNLISFVCFNLSLLFCAVSVDATPG